MKQSNKLNKALQDAFQGQTEPLYEAQWERLSAALGEKKPKRRLFPWFIMFSVVAIACISFGYWLGHTSGTQQNPGNQIAGGEQSTVAGVQSSAVENAQTSGTDFNNPENNNGQETHSNGQNSTTRQAQNVQNPAEQHAASNTNSTNASSGSVHHQLHTNASNSAFHETITETSEPIVNNEFVNSTDPMPDLEFSLPPITLQKIRTKRIIDTLPSSISLAGHRPIVLKHTDQPPSERSKFALNLSTGLSPVHFRISGVVHDERLHKDSRTVFDQSNKNSKSYFVNLGFDWFMLKKVPLSFSSGLQYRQIIQDVNFDYQFTEIAFRNVDGTILGYIPDTIFPINFRYISKNYLDFVNIPIKAAYMFPLGGKNELQLSGGLNFSVIVGANGSSLSVNEARIKPLSESYKKALNIGFIGGVQFSRNIYKPWWLGVEAQWQQNSLNYDAQYGVIRSKINISNYNINLKYKF